MKDDSSCEVSLELRFSGRPLFPMIGCARRFIGELYAPLLGPDASSRMGMVAHELLENLAKYSDDGPVELCVGLVRQGEQAAVARISTKNRVTSSRVRELVRILDDVSSASDPHARYLEYMDTSVRRSEGSGLGLIRIRAEGEMNFSYSLSETEVCIRAEAVMPLLGSRTSWRP